MNVEIYNETDYQIDTERVLRVARHAFEFMQVHPLSELGIKFVDANTMEAYHLEFMDEAGPTDVLSWPSGEFDYVREEGLPSASDLGSIALCPEVALAQAVENGHEMINELLLLTVHGILHLLGYDHAEPEEHRVMFGLQADILLSFYTSENEGQLA